MKYLSLLLIMLLVSCNGIPHVIPSETNNNMMAYKLKNDIDNNICGGYSWLFWYIPVLFLVVAWGWRELIRKRPKQ